MFIYFLIFIIFGLVKTFSIGVQLTYTVDIYSIVDDEYSAVNIDLDQAIKVNIDDAVNGSIS
jgi:hypothetical protein